MASSAAGAFPLGLRDINKKDNEGETPLFCAVRGSEQYSRDKEIEEEASIRGEEASEYCQRVYQFTLPSKEKQREMRCVEVRLCWTQKANSEIALSPNGRTFSAVPKLDFRQCILIAEE